LQKGIPYCYARVQLNPGKNWVGGLEIQQEFASPLPTPSLGKTMLPSVCHHTHAVAINLPMLKQTQISEIHTLVVEPYNFQWRDG